MLQSAFRIDCLKISEWISWDFHGLSRISWPFSWSFLGSLGLRLASLVLFWVVWSLTWLSLDYRGLIGIEVGILWIILG